MNALAGITHDRMSKIYIRVSKEEDGRTVKRELCVDGYKVADVSTLDIIEGIMNLSSSLRYKDGA